MNTFTHTWCKFLAISALIIFSVNALAKGGNDDDADDEEQPQLASQTQARSQTCEKIEAARYVGLELSLEPEYMGSHQYRLSRSLVFEYQNPNGWFASSKRGLGYTVLDDTYEWSAALNYRSGRTESSNSGSINTGSASLLGMGDILLSATADLSLNIPVTEQLSVGLQAELPVTNRDNGNLYKLGVNLSLLDLSKDQLDLELLVSYADAAYAQTNYGVTLGQHLRSAYPRYQGQAGLESLTASVEWNHVYNDKWALLSSLEIKQLLGNPAGSPLSKNKTNVSLAVSLNYSF
ncbi:MipA/OmpV family protein [Undibacterium sp. Ren11W]|uniref:MipA/OmpV family protein n=1 Tax=Undibacterium sp. Ren11W TaxID=3413045 RepID=UPI003BF1F732